MLICFNEYFGREIFCKILVKRYTVEEIVIDRFLKLLVVSCELLGAPCVIGLTHRLRIHIANIHIVNVYVTWNDFNIRYAAFLASAASEDFLRAAVFLCKSLRFTDLSIIETTSGIFF